MTREEADGAKTKDDYRDASIDASIAEMHCIYVRMTLCCAEGCPQA